MIYLSFQVTFSGVLASIGVCGVLLGLSCRDLDTLITVSTVLSPPSVFF